MFTMLNVVYDHFLTRKTQVFTLLMLSRTSDNTTSQNIGGDQCMDGPPTSNFGGTVPPVPPRSPPLLDSTAPLNFRPIANVSFMSKIIEKIATYQLTVYLETNKLLPECQSGFRRGHSTETLLLHISFLIFMGLYPGSKNLGQ